MLTPARRAALTAAADLLFPAGEYAGAAELGVPDYITGELNSLPAAEAAALVAALDELNAGATGGFAELPVARQEAVLGALIARADPADDPARGAQLLLTLGGAGYYGREHAVAGQRSPWTLAGFPAQPGRLGQPGWPLAEAVPVPCAFADVASRYDAVVIGTGPGGSTAAAVLAAAGWEILLVDRGDQLSATDLHPDHLRNDRRASGPLPATARVVEGEARVLREPGGERILYPEEAGLWHRNPMTLGGGARVYGAQAWRFTPEDFRMASEYGMPPGTSLADWPISYDELEPFYTQAEQAIGVAGGGDLAETAGYRRSRPFPMPPPPASPVAVFLRAGADALGFGTGPVPLAVNTVPYDGRPACLRCGTCVGFACPGDMKNGAHNTVLPRALATGRCTLLLGARAERIVTAGGRTGGVTLAAWRDGRLERRTIRCGHVVVAAGAIESARLLLSSAHDGEPDGMGNGHDQVGRHLQGHVYAGAIGLFDADVQDGLGPGPCIATGAFRHRNPGLIGGGIVANDFVPTPLNAWEQLRSAGLIAAWGRQGQQDMRRGYRQMALVMGAGQELPQPASRVRLSGSVTDRHGLPAVELSGGLRPEDRALADFLALQADRWLTASGTRATARVLHYRQAGPSGFQHQAGTCRMGTDPRRSVTDRYGALWSQPAVVVADASTHVTNGSANPVLTVYANALRIAAHLAAAG